MFKEIWYGLNVYADRLFNWIVGMSWEDFSYGAAHFDSDDEEVTTMERKYDKRRLLKIKLKSLMEEVKIIRHEEDKLKPAVRKGSEGAAKMVNEMAHHRRRDLRRESRATLLAYGFIRGRSYEQVEPKVTRYHVPVEVKQRVERVVKMVARYGTATERGMGIEMLTGLIRSWMGLNERYEKV